MVYRFNNVRTDLSIGTMPEENINYSRKGGCFVSLCKGVCLTILLVVFISLLLVIVFFSTKHAYEKNTGITLEEYVKKPSPFIEKIDKMAKLFIPKTYRLIIQPIFNEKENSFTFKGTVFIVVAARRGNNKKIELNVKNLLINEDDVYVYKSFKIPNLKNANLFKNDNNYLRVKRYSDDDDNHDNGGDDIHDDSDKNDYESLDEKLLNNNNDDVMIVTNEPDLLDNQTNEITTNNLNENELSTDYKLFNSSSPIPTTKKCDNEFDDDFDEIVMKKVNKIDFDEDDDKMIISLDVELRRNIFYTVKIKFSGNMTTNRGLFYKTFIDQSGNLRYLAATYTTPESARLIFPCFDDDDFQSTFDLSIIRSANMKSASNAQINNTESLDGDLKIDNYYTTPPIPASELGFVITDIKSNSLQINNNLSVQLFTQEENVKNLEYIMLTIQNVANILENYTNVPFNMNELSYVIVPNRHNNYREIKRGIIFTSESIIPISSDVPLDYNEITYEMALQWFDGINQYELDEEIWLRSALPLFLQQVTLSEIESAYYESLYLITKSEIMRDEMRYYKFKLTRETDDDRLNEDIISLMKNKGLCILKMFNTSFSENVFRAAIREYFRKRTHNQTVEFYTTLQDAALSNQNYNPYEINILEVFDQWINYERFPVVTVTRNLTSNQFILAQRWLGFKEEKNNEIWHIPITYINSLDDNILNRTFWMTKKSQCIEIENQLKNETFILLNPSGIGYYRTNYDEITWNYLIILLKNHFSDFTQLTRAILVDDAFTLARYNLLNYRIVFKLVSCLKTQEHAYTTWRTILDNFEFIIDNMPTSEVFYVQEYIIDLIDHIHKTLITNKYDEEIDTIVIDEDTNLRNLIRRWACKLGNKNCINSMRQKLNNLNEKTVWDQSKSKDELYLILCTVITYGGYDDWIGIKRNLTKSLIYPPTVIIEALGCTREPSLIAKYINLILTDDINKQKYSNNILKAISENRIMFKFVMEYLYDHWKEISARYELKQIAIIFKRISSDIDFNMLQNIFKKYSHTFDDRDKDIFKHILHCIKTTLKWKSEISIKITKNIFVLSDDN